jgi:hypothetical protein
MLNHCGPIHGVKMLWLVVRVLNLVDAMLLIPLFVVRTLGAGFPLLLAIAKTLGFLTTLYTHLPFLVHALDMHWLIVCRLAPH